MNKRLALTLSLVAAIVISGCTQTGQIIVDRNNSHSTQSISDDTEPYGFDFWIKASWQPWQSGDYICKAYERDGDVFKTILKVEIHPTELEDNLLNCGVVVDGTARRGLYGVGEGTHDIMGNLVPSDDGGVHNAEDITKPHTVELCCKAVSTKASVHITSEEICRTASVNKLCG